MTDQEQKLLDEYEHTFGVPFPLLVLRGSLVDAIEQSLASGEEYEPDMSNGTVY